MTAPVHFELEVGYDCLYQPLCENQAGCDAIADIHKPVEMTPDERFVTCRRCIEALGYAVEQLVDVERGVAPDNGNARITA